jgi:ABC-type multidrug transport system ATPase subunit
MKNINNDDDDDLASSLNKFNVNLPFIDDMIAKILNDIFISDDLSINEKKLIRIFINNMKKTNFSAVKLLYIISITSSLKKYINNLQGDNLKKQIIIKGLSFIIGQVSLELGVSKYVSEENYDIDELLTTILNTYNDKLSFKILSTIEKNNTDEIENLKYEYQANIQLVLKLNQLFTRVIYHYIKLINYMTTLYLIPVLYDSDGLTTLAFLRTTLLNVYSLILFNTIYKKCELNHSTEDRLIASNENSIEYFFNNIDKIIEGKNGNFKKELYEISNQVVNFINNSSLKKTFKLSYFSKERRNQTKIYNLFETIISIIVNNTYLLLGSDKFKTYFDGFSNNKIEFKEVLKTSDSLFNILNHRKYVIQNVIVWDENNNYEYAFTLNNVSLEYMKNSLNGSEKINLITNLTIDFEINKFHFIYGDSGCGKTTLLKVMLKKESIKDGEIKFLGIYENYTYLSILKNVVTISPDSKLFPKSLYFNLTYKIDSNTLKNNSDIIMKEIVKYMNLFGLEVYIPNIKNKNAGKLSKGQKQKINIIYAILNIMFSNTKILFLDESTSNIDETTEQIIFNELVNLYKVYPFTLFYISHKLTNSVFSDYTYHISFEAQSITKKKTQPLSASAS